MDDSTGFTDSTGSDDISGTLSADDEVTEDAGADSGTELISGTLDELAELSVLAELSGVEVISLFTLCSDVLSGAVDVFEVLPSFFSPQPQSVSDAKIDKMIKDFFMKYSPYYTSSE